MSGGDSQRDRPDNPRSDAPGDQQARERSLAERVTLAVGIVVILALLGLVTYVSVTGGDQPPIVVATPVLAEMREEGGLYYVPIAVTNDGSRTAEDIVIRAELAAGDAPEIAEFMLDFLAGDETRQGTVVFPTNPAQGTITVRVASFR